MALSGIIINSKLFTRLQEMFEKLQIGGRPIHGNCLKYMMMSSLLPF